MDDTAKIYEKYGIYEKLSAHINYLDGYGEYIESIKDKADEMLTFSIFFKKGSFSYRNILKTPGDYQHLRGIPIKLGIEEGIIAATNFRIADILVIIFTFLVCALLFWHEKENGIFNLIKSCKNGRTGAIAAKLMATGLVCILSAVILYGSVFCISGWIFGFGDTSRFIQSMPYFEKSNLLLTTGQYIMLFLMGKVSVVLLISLVFALLFMMFDNSTKVYLSIIAILAAGYTTYTYIMPLSPFNIFKYINIFAFLDMGDLLGRYNNISFFGLPIGRVTISGIVIFASIMSLSITNIMLFAVQRKATTRDSFGPLGERLKGFLYRRFKWLGSTSLIWHESYKLMFSGGAILIILSLIYIGHSDLLKKAPESDFYEMVYDGYMEKLEGAITPEKETFILNEREYFETLSDRQTSLGEMYESNEITKAQYDIAMADIASSQVRERVFNDIEEQYLYLLDLEGSGRTASFINRINSDYIFHYKQRDIKNALILSAMIIIAISTVFCREYKNDMINILLPTKNGRSDLFIRKVIVSSVLAILLTLLVYLPEYINMLKFYNLGDYRASVQSIQRFKNLGSINIGPKNLRYVSPGPNEIGLGSPGFNISIGGFIAAKWLVTILGAVSMSLFVIFISIISKSQAITVFIAALSIIAPILMEALGMGILRFFSYNNTFLINNTLTSLPPGLIQKNGLEYETS